ncbi:MAG: hypothetical protein H5T69_20040 [Chloroflexi bacterium]|nr:hypothetical protein [Chloroflexota bacterium]
MPEGTTLRSLIVDLLDRYDQVVPISADQGVGIDELLKAVQQVLFDQMVELDLLLPYRAGDVLALWREQGIVETEQYEPQGVHVRGRVPRWLAGVVTGDHELNRLASDLRNIKDELWDPSVATDSSIPR